MIENDLRCLKTKTKSCLKKVAYFAHLSGSLKNHNNFGNTTKTVRLYRAKIGRKPAIIEAFEQSLPLYFVYLDEYEQDRTTKMLDYFCKRNLGKHAEINFI